MATNKPGGAMYDDFRRFFEDMYKKHGVGVQSVDASWIDVSTSEGDAQLLLRLEITGSTRRYVGSE
jgi:hypothetical protein